MTQNKRLIGTIDVTPTWVSMVPTMVALIESGNAEGRAAAIEELTRMAKIADAYAELQRTTGKRIHHKDGDPTNNDPSNLELR